MPRLPGSDDAPDNDDDAFGATERLMEGWEASPIPVGPDGMPSIERKLLVPLPVASNSSPTLCEVGPCDRYHRIVVQLDGAQPTDGTIGEIHGEVIRTCYPAPGREFSLDGTPVWECNRWRSTASTSLNVDAVRAARLAFPDVLAKWKADRLADMEAQQAEIDRVIAESTESPTESTDPAPPPLG